MMAIPAVSQPPIIALFCDFGIGSPYLAQIEAKLHQLAPEVKFMVLFADAPTYEPTLAAYLLPAYLADFPTGTVFLAVVDPGVGGPRQGVVLNADGAWFVGPENGLFDVIAKRALSCASWQITADWPCSASFHGRDLFAPIAAGLCVEGVANLPVAPLDFQPTPDLAAELPRIIYIDHFGNLMTGIRAKTVDRNTVIQLHGHRVKYARTFCEVAVNTAFWYENANGLLELAVNQARADRFFGAQTGDGIIV